MQSAGRLQLKPIAGSPSFGNGGIMASQADAASPELSRPACPLTPPVRPVSGPVTESGRAEEGRDRNTQTPPPGVEVIEWNGDTWDS